jgi:hypothetical protein
MNIHIAAEREIFIPKTGKTDKQRIYFDCWQTPTIVTREILQNENPIVAYIQWVSDNSNDETIDCYADNDLFNEGDIVAVEIINRGREHIKELQVWIIDSESCGYTIEVFEM